MKLNVRLPKADKLLQFLKQYKYVLLIIAAGIFLLAWSPGGADSPAPEEEGLSGSEEDFSVEALEDRLGRVLSRIEGAGEVSVMLTVQNGMERVLATDTTARQEERGRELEEETVIISTKNGEEAVLVTQRYPTFQGALIVCPGGGSPEVRLALTRAVAALTGLGSDRITVCKGS